MSHSFARLSRVAVFVLLSLTPWTIQAHPAHGLDSSWAQGWVHPFSGLDHLLAMLAVGLWAARLGGRARWALPACFVGVMMAGGALGMAGVQLPGVEAVVLASVFVLGLAVATTVRAPLALSGALVAVFALAHGQAHGAEMTAGSSRILYAFGFVGATATLHLAGVGGGEMLLRMQRVGWFRLAGAGIAAAGGLLCLDW